MNNNLRRWIVLTTLVVVVVSVAVIYGLLWADRFHPTGQIAGSFDAKRATMADRPASHLGVHTGGYPKLLLRYEAQRFDALMHRHRFVSLVAKWDKHGKWWESSQAAQATPAQKG